MPPRVETKSQEAAEAPRFISESLCPPSSHVPTPKLPLGGLHWSIWGLVPRAGGIRREEHPPAAGRAHTRGAADSPGPVSPRKRLSFGPLIECARPSSACATPLTRSVRRRGFKPRFRGGGASLPPMGSGARSAALRGCSSCRPQRWCGTHAHAAPAAVFRVPRAPPIRRSLSACGRAVTRKAPIFLRSQRTLELLRQMGTFQKGCKAIKLFSKHIKQEEQAEELQVPLLKNSSATPSRSLTAQWLLCVCVSCARRGRSRSPARSRVRYQCLCSQGPTHLAVTRRLRGGWDAEQDNKARGDRGPQCAPHICAANPR